MPDHTLGYVTAAVGVSPHTARCSSPHFQDVHLHHWYKGPA